MAYYVYVLKSSRDGRLYTGYTQNLEERLRRHNAGKVPSTRNRVPFTLVYSEVFGNKTDAIKRERYFKTPEGGLLKQKLIAGLL